MKIVTFENGKVDDLYVGKTNVKNDRVGKCKYQFDIVESPKKLTFFLWTTKKGTIEFDIFEEDNFPWLFLRRENGIVEEFVVENVQLHFENLDRGIYPLVSFHKGECWTCCIHSKGYLNTKFKEDI